MVEHGRSMAVDKEGKSMAVDKKGRSVPVDRKEKGHGGGGQEEVYEMQRETYSSCRQHQAPASTIASPWIRRSWP